MQVLLVGTANAEVLVLRQDDGQALVPALQLNSSGHVMRIVVYEDGTAMVTVGVRCAEPPTQISGGYILRFLAAQSQQNNNHPACKFFSSSCRFTMSSLCKWSAACCTLKCAPACLLAGRAPLHLSSMPLLVILQNVTVEM